jgi:hypothetical protein
MKEAKDEFEVSEDGVTHIPTGATFRHIPGKAGEGTMHLGMLVDHPEYKAADIQRKMRKRWAQYVLTSKPLIRVR